MERIGTGRIWNSYLVARFLDTCSVYACCCSRSNFKQRCVNLCGMDRGNVWLENKKRRATFMRLLIYLERESWRSLSSRILGRKVSTTIVVPRSPELCLRESRDFWTYQLWNVKFQLIVVPRIASSFNRVVRFLNLPSFGEWRCSFFDSLKRVFIRIVWFLNLSNCKVSSLFFDSLNPDIFQITNFRIDGIYILTMQRSFLRILE